MLRISTQRILLGTFIYVVLSALLLTAYQTAEAQRIPFRIFNTEETRLKPPTGLRIVSSDPALEARVSYQDILDALSSNTRETRENAAITLYKEREKHSYSIDLLMPNINDNNVIVTQYVSSCILDVVNRRPGTWKSLLGYFEDILLLYNTSNDPSTRANCIALISLATENYEKISQLIKDTISAGPSYEFTNAVIATSNLSPRDIELYRILANQINAKGAQNSLIAEAMVSVAVQFKDSTEIYNANRLFDGSALLQKANSQEFAREIGIIDSIASSIQAKLQGSRTVATDRNSIVLKVESNFDWSLLNNTTAKFNGKTVSIEADLKNNTIKFMGNDVSVLEGVNMFEYINYKVRVWIEDNLMKSFNDPYRNSYAIIAAIDKYKRIGYENLGNMVNKSELFKNQLIKIGFPERNIITLYDEAATSINISSLLKEFWQGGRYSDADRLVFYFGGHGDFVEGPGSAGTPANQTGFLVTFDYDKSRPTASSLLMKDLTGSHFENIVSKHVLMLIDSCSAGLAIPKFQDLKKDLETLKKFKKYVIIETETKRPARNIIVAGTGEQKALWQNGGIFTDSLIEGLTGEADFNKDGIIEFDELSYYIHRSVQAKAQLKGVKQEPRGFKANMYGEGSVIFVGY